MDKVAGMSELERSELIQETAAQLGLAPAAVEKDFWVCWVLKKIFEHPVLSRQLLFKGGTSLSKCYGLIDRFSEDIDLILDWRLLTSEDLYATRSNTQQDKFNKYIETAAQEHVVTVLKPEFEKLFAGIGALEPDSVAPRALLFRYPRAFESGYIRPEVLLEVGPMSAMAPSQEMVVQSQAAAAFPHFFEDPNVPVCVIEPRKTFWDKITILHVEAHRPVTKSTPDRYSRHYYDIYKMLGANVKAQAMDDLDLLRSVAAFKHKFYPQGWANYEAALEGRFTLVPQTHTMDALQRDYEGMAEMIYGQVPDFDVIMESIREFEAELSEAMTI